MSTHTNIKAYDSRNFKMLLYLRALILFIIIPMITMFFSIACVFVIIPFFERRVMDRTINIWSKLLCNLSGVRVHVSGQENLKNLHSALFVSNHQSHFDIPVLFLAIPNSLRMVAKKELFMIPLFGHVLAKAGFVSLDRERVDASQEALTSMKKHFDNGECFWIAPEGTRYQGEGVGNFKSGAFYLSLKTEAAIVPVCIYGTHKVLPKEGLLVNRTQLLQDVFVQILPPVFPSGQSRGELKNAVRDQILSAYQGSQRVSSSLLNLSTQV